MIKPSVKDQDAKKYVNSEGFELVCLKKDDRFVYFVFENKNLIEIEVENIGEYPIGSVLYGKISEISAGIDAAFVSLPDKSKAFLKLNGLSLKCESNVCVKVTRAGSKNKLLSVVLEDNADCSHFTDFTVVSLGKNPYSYLLEKYDFERILCEDDKMFDYLSKIEFANDANKGKLLKYSDKMVSLSVLFSLSKHLEDAVGKTVWLKSGANIVIENTQAMTVIDVNSAKKQTKNGKTDNVYEVNCEAAEEIFRQMNLRNLSGIIIVDFINMENKEECENFMKFLRNLCINQKSYTKVIDITPLGLAEITRKKSGPTIYDLNLV